MTPSPQDNDFGPAAGFIDAICAALQSAELIDARMRQTASAVAVARALDLQLAQIQASLDRIEARLVELEHELTVLIRPSRPV
jgi:hypothetical protein